MFVRIIAQRVRPRQASYIRWSIFDSKEVLAWLPDVFAMSPEREARRVLVNRTLLAGSCAYFFLISATMIVAPQYFYLTIPGVAASGPLNVHLLRDVGIAYAVISIGFGFALRDLARASFVTAAAALYLDGHAALHFAMALSSGNTSLSWSEAPGVYVPAVVASAIAFRFARSRRGNFKA